MNMSNFNAQVWQEHRKMVTRRYFFRQCGVGLGAMALASLLRNNSLFAAPAANPLAVHAPQFPAKAKRVIYLFQAGGPSQLDLFNHCPGLAKYDGHPIPPEFVKNQNTPSSNLMRLSSLRSLNSSVMASAARNSPKRCLI